MAHDLERGDCKEYLKGYPSLANFMARDSYHGTIIYRRFGRLATRNLLYLQSDLMELEALQDSLDQEDLQASTTNKNSARDWQILKQRASEPNNTRERQRFEVAMEIREKLKEYRDAMALEIAALSMDTPNHRTLDAFRNEFNNVNPSKPSYPVLGGHGARILDNVQDLVSLGRLSDDRLSRFIRHYFAFLLVKRRQGPNLAYLSERRLRRIVTCINIILAALLLFGAIINLYYVSSVEKRLGLIAGYTAAFAACVGFVTNARRAEVFAATAAYAAVLVVFVSSNLGIPR